MNTLPKPHPAAISMDDVGWRKFPQFEKLLSTDDPSPLLGKVEKTCRQLDAMIKSGSETEKQRAKAAMTAYGRSLDLFRTLGEERDKALAQK